MTLAKVPLSSFFLRRQNVIFDGALNAHRLPCEAREAPFVMPLELVRAEGLEPPQLASPEPKSGASTNSATPASGDFSTWAPSASAALYTSLPVLRHRKKRYGPATGLTYSASPFGRQESDCAIRALG
jgi:hypothetical protein